jgi:hypothetical protein
MSHHQIAKAVDVVAIEIASEVAPSFAHSQYDKHAFPVGFIAAAHPPLSWQVTPAATALST